MWWNVIGNIASICSIIALPIAIWQIFDLKSKVKRTEISIKKVLEIKEYQKLNALANIVSKQYTEISDLISSITKKGTSTQKVTEKSKEIKKEINRCVVEISPQYTDILKSF